MDIPTSELKPLVEFLVKTYGSPTTVSEVIGVSRPALYDVMHGRRDRIGHSLAQRIVDAVLVLRHGDRTLSSYENDSSPRLPTAEEQALPKEMSKWRPAEMVAR